MDLLILYLLFLFHLVEILIFTHLPCINLVEEFRKFDLFLCLFMCVRLERRSEIVRVLLILCILLFQLKFSYLLVSLGKNILISFVDWQSGLFSLSFPHFIKDLLWLLIRFSLLWLFVYLFLFILDSLELSIFNQFRILVHTI